MGLKSVAKLWRWKWVHEKNPNLTMILPSSYQKIHHLKMPPKKPPKLTKKKNPFPQKQPLTKNVTKKPYNLPNLTKKTPFLLSKNPLSLLKKHPNLTKKPQTLQRGFPVEKKWCKWVFFGKNWYRLGVFFCQKRGGGFLVRIGANMSLLLFIDVCILYIASQRLSNCCSGIMIASFFYQKTPQFVPFLTKKPPPHFF